MKRCLWLVIIMNLPLLSCGQSGIPNDQPGHKPSAKAGQGSIHAPAILTASDAEKILGEPAHLSDSSTAIKAGASTWKCAYTADTKDQETGKTGNVYFLSEQYDRLASARERYSFTKTANENHGIRELQDVGDEAYFHSDNQNFYFIMIRKGSRVLNMKVNKITSKTSLDEFNRIARKMVATL